MIRQLSSLILFSFVLSLLLSCAQMSSPTGGQGDITSPVLLETRPTTGATNIVPMQKFSFTFSEWVDPKSVRGALTIYPKIPGGFTTKVTTRTITLKPTRGFLPNTTYHLILSSDLTDFSGNPILSVGEIIFSTGEVIDTASISGCIPPHLHKDSIPPKVALFMADSIRMNDSLYLGDMTYLSQSDTNGFFEFSSIKEGEYALVGFIDGNQDNKITPGEEVFIGNKQFISTGSSSELLLKANSSILRDQITAITILSPKELLLTLSRPRRSDPFSLVTIEEFTEKQDDDDTLPPPHRDTLSLSFLDSTTFLAPLSTPIDEEKRYRLITHSTRRFQGDSVVVAVSDTIINNGKIIIDSLAPTLKNVQWEIHTPLYPQLLLQWNMPVNASLGDTILLYDSLEYAYAFLITERKGATITAQPSDSLKLANTYSFTLPKGIVRSYNGTESKGDTTTYTFELPPQSSLTERVTLHPSQKQLINHPLLYWTLSTENTQYLDTLGVFKWVVPGTYYATGFYDINENGTYDEGTLFPFSQGDVAYQFEEEINLRPRWEVDHTLPPMEVCPQPEVIKSDSISQ